jgi:delta 1-pyrroline-5-carboxylate dehydrogenase
LIDLARGLDVVADVMDCPFVTAGGRCSEMRPNLLPVGDWVVCSRW